MDAPRRRGTPFTPTLEVMSLFTGVEGHEMVDSSVTRTASVTPGARAIPLRTWRMSKACAST